ncbi:MAG: Tn3 family transposase [Gammaproteobacteria bacterium]|nr:Tn3 family transposase [Gammaproteobacteria bacterium]
MTILNILTSTEQNELRRPPKLTKAERAAAFIITNEIRQALRGTSNPISKAGFLLQLGYFKAAGQFYSAEDFHKRDIQYVCTVLEQGSINIGQYSENMAADHRKKILGALEWQKTTQENLAELKRNAIRFIENQELPKNVLAGLRDECWKRRWVVPSYAILAELISDAYNRFDSDCIAQLKSNLTDENVADLESLVYSEKDPSRRNNTAPIAALKRIDHSLRVGAIRESVKALATFADYFQKFEHVLTNLALTDKATDFFATWLSKADHQQLTQFKDRHKTYLHLLAFIKHQFFQRQDTAIDILLKSVTATRYAVNNRLRELKLSRHDSMAEALDTLRDAHMSASTFADAVVAITRSKEASANEKYFKIESLVTDYLEMNSPSHPEITSAFDPLLWKSRRDAEFFTILEGLSRRLQNRVSAIVKTVTFDESSSDQQLLSAILHFKATDGEIDDRAPAEFLDDKEYAAVCSEDGFRVSLYKALLFFHMAREIKAGKLNLKYSYRYRAIHDYLIGVEEWRNNRDSILEECGLVDFANPETVLQGLRGSLDKQFREFNERLLKGKNEYFTVRADGRPQVTTPPTDYANESTIAAVLAGQGIVPILKLLKAIDPICHFSGAFKHHSPKRVKLQPSPELLMGGLLANGCNIGLGKLSKISTGLNVDALRNTVNWFFSEANLQEANRRIIAAIDELALPDLFRSNLDALHSSSDGRKLSVSVDCLHANFSFKYFGKDKGVTDYTFIDERQVLFHSLVFSASDREAAYVIDGLLQNDVAKGHIHSTDTHGFTEQVFGATHLLGIAFAPRLAKPHKQTLYGFTSRQTLAKRGYPILPSRSINRKIILDNWEDILRFMATIKTRRATASQLFKRLSSYEIDHPLYRAIKEFGRIIKTQFLLTYFDDVELRQQIQKQLNRVELANRFSGAVFFDNDQAFQVSSVHDQQTAMACKQVLQNSIILWNYLSLTERVLATTDDSERANLIIAIQRGSVITWAHVNLRGEYSFTPPSGQDGIFDFRRLKALDIE